MIVVKELTGYPLYIQISGGVSEKYKILQPYPRYCRNGMDKKCDYPAELPDCVCKDKCHTKNYGIKTKKTKISENSLRHICNLWHPHVWKNKSETIMREKCFLNRNFVSVCLKFQDLHYKEFFEIPVHSFWRFLSDIGGSMGLYLGASILTLLGNLQCMIGITMFCLCGKRGY